MCKLDWCCLFHSRSLQLPQKRHQSQRGASQTYEFQGSICFDQSFGFLSPVITQICRCGLPARIMNSREVFLSPNFHICDNHIPAILHRTYNLLKLRTRLVLNDFSSKSSSYRLHIYFLLFISSGNLVANKISRTNRGNISILP